MIKTRVTHAQFQLLGGSWISDRIQKHSLSPPRARACVFPFLHSSFLSIQAPPLLGLPVCRTRVIVFSGCKADKTAGALTHFCSDASAFIAGKLRYQRGDLTKVTVGGRTKLKFMFPVSFPCRCLTY